MHTNAQIIRAAARYDHAKFTRAAFRWNYRFSKMDAYHFRLIAKLIDEILAGKRKRVLINMPPRYGKTEEFVIMLNGRIFAVNPAALCMHLSYSKNLVLKNSVKIKDLMRTPQYRAIFPETMIKKDTEERWTTTAGGEFYATTTSGQVTGFECGRSGDPFDGIMVIDDPQKAKGALSAADRESMKDVVTSAISTRLNHEDTPVIVIQQRLHEDDVSAFLLNGGTGDVWDTLVLQALSEDGRPPEYYREFSHCNLLNYQRQPGALWPARKSEAALIRIREARESDDTNEPRGKRAFEAQYMQNPAGGDISLFESDWLKTYKEADIPLTLSRMWIRIDTAEKGKETSDHNGLLIFGEDKRDRSKVYLIDAVRKRCDFPALIDWCVEHIARAKSYESQSINTTHVIIEDANIGSALKSTLDVRLPQDKIRVRTEMTPKYGSKFDRAMEAVPYLQQGRLFVPSERTRFMHDHDMAGIKQFTREFNTFNTADTHKSDDLLDPAIWEIVARYGNAAGPDKFIYDGF